MSILKNLIRKPDKPLIQVIKRFNEIHALKSNNGKEEKTFKCSGSQTSGPLIENEEHSQKVVQYTTLKMEKFTIKYVLKLTDFF